MSMLFAYMAGGEGVGVEVLKYFVRGARIFSTYFVCVCGGGGGGGGIRSITSPSVKKNYQPLLLTNDLSL